MHREASAVQTSCRRLRHLGYLPFQPHTRDARYISDVAMAPRIYAKFFDNLEAQRVVHVKMCRLRKLRAADRQADRVVPRVQDKRINDAASDVFALSRWRQFRWG